MNHLLQAIQTLWFLSNYGPLLYSKLWKKLYCRSWDTNLHDLGSQLCQNCPFDPKHIFGGNSCPPPGPFDREASDILKRAVYILT